VVWCYLCDDEVPEDSHKKLLDCVSSLRKSVYESGDKSANQHLQSQQPLPYMDSVENKIIAGLETIMPLLSNDDSNKSKEVPATQMSVSYNIKLPPKNRNQVQVQEQQDASIADNSPIKTSAMLPRVRGLSNLGNTCFFNAVVQNLSQTPFLLENLEEALETGEKFELPGGELKLNDNETIDLGPIRGELGDIGTFTKALFNTLDQMQRSGGVFTPRDLLSQFTTKWPQFGGGDQHDSHEALRHLLESVRNEDLRRFQSVILHNLGYNSRVDPKNVNEEDKQKIKFFGKKAEDRILHPEPVFRGYMVSTLTCQECNHISPRQEYFLDISLPVTADKPQPPTRRKTSPEPVYVQPQPIPTKSQIKRERKAERKAKRQAKIQNRKANVNAILNPPNDDDQQDEAEQKKEDLSSNSSPLSDSDADVEDNLSLTDEKQSSNRMQVDANGNQAISPQNPEKPDDMPENPFKAETDPKNIVCEMSLSSSGVANLNSQILKLKVEPEGDERERAIKEQQKKCQQRQRERLTSYIDWSNTLSPRLQCPDGELSLQSCLNIFTSVELMTGSNKVGCEACTERINGKKGKTVYTTATKQFLISSPPAVLILHLKRFQVGMRGMFRKIAKHVSFPLILDIGPFCASKVKLLHHVNRNQKKIMYSLYGIVEHSGGMFGEILLDLILISSLLISILRWSLRCLCQSSSEINKERSTLEFSRARNKS
jgi:ubiquitin carboxyl-terminal hydrolase 16/45